VPLLFVCTFDKEPLGLMPSAFLYTQVVSTGFAPNVEGGVLSFAVCASRVRAAARPGDVVIGFASRGEYGNGQPGHIMFWFLVEETVPLNKYYQNNGKWSSRKDNLYEIVQAPERWRNLPHPYDTPWALRHRAKVTMHNVGPPKFRNAVQHLDRMGKVLLARQHFFNGSVGDTIYTKMRPPRRGHKTLRMTVTQRDHLVKALEQSKR
jgi:hypothetical protein